MKKVFEQEISKETQNISEQELNNLQNYCEELIKMLVSSIKTSKGL